jgi:hypothetical protein
MKFKVLKSKNKKLKKKVLIWALVETGRQMEGIKFLECLRDSYHLCMFSLLRINLLSDCIHQLVFPVRFIRRKLPSNVGSRCTKLSMLMFCYCSLCSRVNTRKNSVEITVRALKLSQVFVVRNPL